MCLDRAARDIGATGGTRIVLRSAEARAVEGDLYEVTAKVIATYSDQDRELSIRCEANDRQVDSFEFAS